MTWRRTEASSRVRSVEKGAFRCKDAEEILDNCRYTIRMIPMEGEAILGGKKLRIRNVSLSEKKRKHLVCYRYYCFQGI